MIEQDDDEINEIEIAINEFIGTLTRRAGYYRELEQGYYDNGPRFDMDTKRCEYRVEEIERIIEELEAILRGEPV